MRKGDTVLWIGVSIIYLQVYTLNCQKNLKTEIQLRIYQGEPPQLVKRGDSVQRGATFMIRCTTSSLCGYTYPQSMNPCASCSCMGPTLRYVKLSQLVQNKPNSGSKTLLARYNSDEQPSFQETSNRTSIVLFNVNDTYVDFGVKFSKTEMDAGWYECSMQTDLASNHTTIEVIVTGSHTKPVDLDMILGFTVPVAALCLVLNVIFCYKCCSKGCPGLHRHTPAADNHFDIPNPARDHPPPTPDIPRQENPVRGFFPIREYGRFHLATNRNILRGYLDDNPLDVVAPLPPHTMYMDDGLDDISERSIKTGMDLHTDNSECDTNSEPIGIFYE